MEKEGGRDGVGRGGEEFEWRGALALEAQSHKEHARAKACIDTTFACTLPIFCSFLAFQVHPGSHLPQWRGVSCEHMTKMGNSVSLRTEIPAPIALRWPRFRAVFQVEVSDRK
jgi:hypothetical protein